MGLPAENSGISPQRQNGFGPFFAHANVLMHTGKNVNLFFNKIFEKLFGRKCSGEKWFFSLTRFPLKVNLEAS